MKYNQLSYTISGVYDLVLAVLILFFYRLFAEFFILPFPEDTTYLVTLAFFLAAIGWILVMEGRQPLPNLYVGLASVMVRLAFVFYIIIQASTRNVEYSGFYLVALFDGITGIYLLTAVIRINQGNFGLDDSP